MKAKTKVQITVNALQRMTQPQFTALNENVLKDGLWETADSVVVSWAIDGFLAVSIRDEEDKQMIFIGIEKDGYTHS